MLPSIESGPSFRGMALEKDIPLSWGADQRYLKLEEYYQKICASWHPKRQYEFLMGRFLIHSSLKQWGHDFWDTPVGIGSKREPLFGAQFSASLTHNQNFVIFAMKLGSHCIGIDIEARQRVISELGRQILTLQDELLLESMEATENFNYQDLLTLIFSAKESCFKAFYPFFQEYFGMKDAYFKHVDLENQSFEIVITKRFSARASAQDLVVEGRFILDKFNIFTYLTPLPQDDFMCRESNSYEKDS